VILGVYICVESSGALFLRIGRAGVKIRRIRVGNLKFKKKKKGKKKKKNQGL
jgi:hypothetical protein